VIPVINATLVSTVGPSVPSLGSSSYRKAAGNLPVRIVFATHAYTPAVGGAERYAQGLAEALAQAGHDVHVVTPNSDSAEAFYEYGHQPLTLREEELSGVHIHRIELAASSRWWKPTPRSGPIPVETAHRMWAGYEHSLASALSAIRPDATVVLPHAFPNVEAVFSSGSSHQIAYTPLLHEEDPHWNVDTITSFVVRANIVIALTEWERNRLIRSYRADPTTAVVVPPGVTAPDVETVTPWVTSEPYVVSVGRRVVSKRLPLIAQAVASLRSDGIDLKHLIVGPAGEAAVDDALGRLGDAVEIVGEVDDATKWSIIKGAVASVSMSNRESFGMAAVESWRMRRPVISRRTPVTAELVDDGTTGLLVDDSAELRRSLRQIHDNRPEADAMGNTGYARARRFSWNASRRVILEALQTDPA
jgi:glycosyltransferase involved in cell wall biosynthesis